MFVYRDFELCGRSEAVGVNGMAATSHPAATLAALDVLREGGNAIDAAVCAAAVQAVVEPTQTGIGGDCFALLMRKGDTRPIALNGSGWSPKAASLDWFLERKLTEIAVESPHSVTVPGAVAAWERLIADHGRYHGSVCCHRQSPWRTLDAAFPSGSRGIGVSSAKSSSVTWRRLLCFLSMARTPTPGTLHKQPALARTLAAIAKGGAREFYQGVLPPIWLLLCVRRGARILATILLTSHRNT